MKIRFLATSKNKKTGDIPQTYSTGDTCPVSCFFKKTGACYAAGYPTCLHWRVGYGQWLTIDQFKKELKQKVVPGALIRHNVAGDMAIPGTSQIDAVLVSNLTKAFKGFNAYTYTHCPPTTDNIKVVKKANKAGFVISFSCEKMEDVKKIHKADLPAVLAVASMAKNKRTLDGITFIKCPNNRDNRIKCRDCKKCMNPARKSVIVFPCHGNKKSTAIDSGYLLNL